uniref:cAMP-responsive element modulator-like isoform X1 n=1 Tax=Doryrhamphus excisus TaxID=161450 RepID=UPI0025AE5CA6|nr:cAMP-responsive element modulator-like isoform X1 [Doryrhamphus excisus]XP_057916412.1 cAMP-responsive element modulator-like isoform X1 [Doryrhamphus excisus]
MDSPPSHGLSIEASQALSSMTINSQPLPSESNASEYYANMWSYPNNYFPAVQGGPFCYQNEGAQIVPIAMSTTPAGDMTAPQLQYTSSFFPKGVVQGHPPRKQSERSLKKNREAAREYRKRRKVYVRDLEKRAEQLENENLALKEELKSWKICPEKVK